MSFFGDAFKAVKNVVKSPVTKVVAGGLAFAVPPIGVPAVGALATAETVVRATESLDPQRKRAAKKIVQNTYNAARSGDVSAKAGLRTMLVAKRAVSLKKTSLPNMSGLAAIAKMAKAKKAADMRAKIAAQRAKAKAAGKPMALPSAKGISALAKLTPTQIQEATGPANKGYFVSLDGRVYSGTYRKVFG